ncbi:VOC family protein [Pseudoteredinibacter isoporae]|uniref:VOC family protein n=1 Tax=Pseudoteredinibacter isoporae TaxID=570281 RepID=UPI003109D7A2
MIQGLNHITLSCSSLAQSINFYQNLLGMTLEHQWPGGAYFSAGQLWFCLIEKPSYQTSQQGYTHIAFSIQQKDFEHWKTKLQQANIQEWQANKSEGDSIYFLDPDGYQLELHVGNLQSRLNHARPHENK